MNPSKEQKAYGFPSITSPDDILAYLRSKEQTLASANQNLFSETVEQNDSLSPLQKKMDHAKSLPERTTNPESLVFEHLADSSPNVDAYKSSSKDIKGILITKKERSNWISGSPEKKGEESPLKSPFFTPYEDNSTNAESKEEVPSKASSPCKTIGDGNDDTKTSFILDGPLEPRKNKKVTFIFDGQSSDPVDSVDPAGSPQKVSIITIRKKRAGRKTFSSERDSNPATRNPNFESEKSSPENVRPGSRQNYENLLSGNIESPIKVKARDIKGSHREMNSDNSSNRGFIGRNPIMFGGSLTKSDLKDHFLDTKFSETSPKKNSFVKLPSILSSSSIKPTYESSNSLSPDKALMQKKEDSLINRESPNKVRSSIVSPPNRAFREFKYKGQIPIGTDRMKLKGDGSNITNPKNESKLKINFQQVQTLNKSTKGDINISPVEIKDESKKYSFILHKKQQSGSTLVLTN